MRQCEEEYTMKKKMFIQICIAFGLTWVLTCEFAFPVQTFAQGQYDQNKSNESKRLFLEANIALSEKRYDNAHEMAEKLITDYAGDYQVDLYLQLYVHTFYFLDEDFQKGMLRPTPPGIQKRIEQLKSKQDKTLIDFVTLSCVADFESGNFSTEYLQEILDKFPVSVWRDWAEWMLIQETEYRPREKYQDKSPEERSKLLMRDLYYAGKKFINEHPDSYMLPRLIKATADWACSSGDTTTREESIQMCHRVLKDYPNAEYHCARSRQILRVLLGKEYKESVGCTAEQDHLITLFYCQRPEISEYKKNTVNYVQMIEQVRADTKPDLPKLYYVLVTLAVAIAIAVLIFLLKKSANIHVNRLG